MIDGETKKKTAVRSEVADHGQAARRRWTFGRVLLTAGKVFVLLLVLGLLGVQIPELMYDFGPDKPVMIDSPADLDAKRGSFGRSTYVSIAATPRMETEISYLRYGLKYSYIMLEPYGDRVVVRAYEQPRATTQSSQPGKLLHFRRFIGRLKPFRGQPFYYHVRDLYKKKHQIDIPVDEAYFLAFGDAPEPDGWTVGAMIFCSLTLMAMTYLFFFWQRKPAPAEEAEQAAKEV